MDFSQEYQSKLKTADEAVKVVQSGDWVDYGWCTGTPDAHWQDVRMNCVMSRCAVVSY